MRHRSMRASRRCLRSGSTVTAQRALGLARENVRHQREPFDLLLLARCARASGDARALREAEALMREIGLVDRRIGALL